MLTNVELLHSLPRVVVKQQKYWENMAAINVVKYALKTTLTDMKVLTKTNFDFVIFINLG